MQMVKKATEGQINYWIRKLRNHGFSIEKSQKEIDPYPYSSLQNIPVGARYYVGLLIKQGFNVQHKIR